MPLRIRPAVPADADAVVALACALNEQEGDPTDRLSADVLRREAFGPAPAFRVLVAEDGGIVIGYALFHDSWDTSHAVRGLYLGDIFVSPAARTRGVGRALMAAVAGAARERGAAFVWWTAKPQNETALRFYARLGAHSEPVVAHALAFDAFERLAASADD